MHLALTDDKLLYLDYLNLVKRLTMSKNVVMADGHEDSDAFCPYFQRAIELIGSRWTGAVIRALGAGLYRFSDLTAAVPGLSDRMLSERLKELEAEGIVVRTVIPETPVRIEYRLTEKGRALSSVVKEVSEWAEVWLTPGGVAVS
jgi:DNA-binding HxlR family transcriptional regulator